MTFGLHTGDTIGYGLYLVLMAKTMYLSLACLLNALVLVVYDFVDTNPRPKQGCKKRNIF